VDGRYETKKTAGKKTNLCLKGVWTFISPQGHIPRTSRVNVLHCTYTDECRTVWWWELKNRNWV